MKYLISIFYVYLLLTATAAFECLYEVHPIWKRGNPGVIDSIQESRQFDSLDIAKIACDELTNCKGIFVDSNPQSPQKFKLTFTDILGFDKNWVDITFFKNVRLCWMCPFQKVLFLVYPECVQSCLGFSSLRDATEACMKDQTCFGVAYTNRQLTDSNSNESTSENWSYQLRKGEPQMVSEQNKTTWVKCDHISTNTDINN